MVTEGHDCPQITIYNIEGPLFFGVAQTFQQTIMNTINHKPKILLLRMGKVPFIDITGEAHLASIVKRLFKTWYRNDLWSWQPTRRSIKENRFI